MSIEVHEYLLRPAENQDAPFLYELFCESRRDEFAPLNLPPAALVPLLAMQFRARTMGYSAQFPHAKTSMITVNGHPVGLTSVDYGLDQMHLVDIAVSRAFQRRGLGTRVIAALIEEAQSKGLAVYLSVRFDNPAMRLYERIGFKRTGGGDGLSIAMEILPEKTSRQQARYIEDHAEPADPMSSRWFRRLVGLQLTARSDDGTRVELTLKSVTMIPAYGTDTDMADSFTLDFRGPVTPILSPATTALTTPTGEEICLFLSPAGPRDGAMQYEAVFNRMRRIMPSTG